MPRLTRTPIHLALITLSLLWTLPSLGLLISSLRPPADVISSGWWTVFQHPFEFTQYSLETTTRCWVRRGWGRRY